MINIGDRFVKADEPTKVWIVTELGAPISSIPHYQVVREDYVSRLRTLSEQVLLDDNFYRRIDELAPFCSGKIVNWMHIIA